MSPSPIEFTLRPAGEGDARGLAELWAGAFPGEPRVEVRLRGLLDGSGPYGGLDSCWVAEVGGCLAGGLRQYDFTMYLWGVPYRVQGLASVAVAPESRRRGVGRRMCAEALRHGRRSGAAFSALFPFRADFYARMGFTLVGELHRYRFATEDLPSFPGREQVVALRGEDRLRLLASFYEDLLPRTHGLVARTAAMWRDRLDGSEQVYAVPGEAGSLRGYAIVSGLRRGRSPDRAILRVEELLASDAEAHRALLGWLSAQRDQWPYLRYDALPGEDFHHLLPHPRTPGGASARGLWFPSAFLLRGPMLRILDLPAVLEGAGLRIEDGIRVLDDEIPENSGVWVVGEEGTVRLPDGSEGTPIPIRALTEQFAAGSLPGQPETLRGWRPALGLRDFRLLDVF